MSGDHNMYSGTTKVRKISIHLVDDYCGQDVLMRESIGETIEDLHDAFRRFALAVGFNNDNVKEYFSED